MFKFKNIDAGLLVLRVTVGGLLLLHGLKKLENPDESMEKLEEILDKNNLPPALSKGAYVGEVAAPIMMIAGYKTQLAASTIMFNMLMAVYTVNLDKLNKREKSGAWGLEVQAFYFLGSLALLLAGGGKCSIDKMK